MGPVSIFSRTCRIFLPPIETIGGIICLLLAAYCAELEASPRMNLSGASAYLPVYKADFWIGRLDNPDEPILAQEQIKELNNAILDEDDEMANVLELEDTVSKQDLLRWLFEDPIPQDKNMFDRKGKGIKQGFYKKLTNNMNVEWIKETNDLIFAVVVKRTDIRAFPTDEPVLKSPSAKDFDAFQYSAIYPPQPVALLHKSKDEKWGFFQTPFVRGWIKLNDIAFAKNRTDITPNLVPANLKHGSEFPTPNSLVITGSRVNVFLSSRKEKSLETVPMGTTLVLQGEDKNRWIVKFPEKDENGNLRWINGFVDKKADVRIGPLVYTKRNVIRQAFKILGEEYGWGGRNGLRDCSSFIKDVFATMGINLPRHSSHQAAAGQVLLDIDESASPEDIKNALDLAVPGITLFGLNGHIMLYLGTINGNYYTLHQLFGYHDKDGFRTVNKVVVTNLELGKGSNMGAIRERVKSVNLLIPKVVN